MLYYQIEFYNFEFKFILFVIFVEQINKSHQMNNN